jgi:hypothetical protein
MLPLLAQPTVQPKTASSRLLLVYRADLGGQLRVDLTHSRATEARVDGHRFESPQLHQVVRAKRRDFLCHRISRHSRGLRRRQSVCWVFSTVSVAHGRRLRPKVSGRKSPFPRLPFATCPPCPISNGRWVRTSTLNRFGWMDQPLAERQTSKSGSFLTPAPAPGVRARATDPARPSAGR